MDLSDGLGRDLPRLAAASGVSYRLDPARLPCRAGCTPEQAVNDGEDYELLIAVAPAGAEVLRAAWPFRTPLTVIGSILPPSARAESGGLTLAGYDHFF
jgi:thiamine-monophosphate kinase